MAGWTCANEHACMCLCVHLCVRARGCVWARAWECDMLKQTLKEKQFWPGFVFTRSWTHPGNLCCQVCFPPTLRLSPAALLSLVLLSAVPYHLTPAYFIPPPPFFLAFFIPGSVWYSKTECMLTPLKYKEIFGWRFGWTVHHFNHQVSLVDWK